MLSTPQVVNRIQQELKTAGVTAFGRAKFASHFLPHILHENEHVRGVVYGRYAEGTGLLRWVEGMLIATELRVIFLDRKPGFEAMDEITYDVVSGVQKSYAWPFASVTLHTRIGNYTLRFANKRCIDLFMHYVEKRRLESLNGGSVQPSSLRGGQPYIDDRALNFLNNHDIAVISTADSTGNVYGAAVHYQVIDNAILCILTKIETQKARNVFTHRQVALTIYDEPAMQTLQLQGSATLETDQRVRNMVFSILSKPKVYGERMEYPPATELPNGAYTVIRITPKSVRLSEFGKRDASVR